MPQPPRLSRRGDRKSNLRKGIFNRATINCFATKRRGGCSNSSRNRIFEQPPRLRRLRTLSRLLLMPQPPRLSRRGDGNIEFAEWDFLQRLNILLHWQLIIDGPLNGRRNMDVDAALLNSVESSNDPRTI